MNKKNLQTSLRIRIRSYLDYLHKQNKDKISEDEDMVLQKLSK